MKTVLAIAALAAGASAQTMSPATATGSGAAMSSSMAAMGSSMASMGSSMASSMASMGSSMASSMASMASSMSSSMAMPTGAGGNSTSPLSMLTATVHVQGAVEGYFNFTYTPTGVRVVGYNFSGFTNTTLGNYAYHLHVNRVGNFSGNTSVAASVARCGAALYHLDPLNVTEAVSCSPAFPQYCQTGDLSGKHGDLTASANGSSPNVDYVDPYLRFFPQPFSLLGRSMVIHGFNKTRLGCGNVISVVDGSAQGGNGTYQNDYVTTNQRAFATAVPIAINSTINSAGLSAINYTLAAPAPNASVTGVFLTTSGGQAVAVPTTYTTGASLPTQALGIPGQAAGGSPSGAGNGATGRVAAGSLLGAVGIIAAVVLA